jgi:hypothetical protein
MTLSLIVAFALGLAAVSWSSTVTTTTTTTTTPDPRVVQLERKNHRWRRYARKLERDNGRKTRILVHSTSVSEAIDLACATYGHCAELWRKAKCESKFDPRATNKKSGAAGLLQFLWSTWSSTPYARFSPYSSYANALAAGWMHTHGRGGEWDCR